MQKTFLLRKYAHLSLFDGGQERVDSGRMQTSIEALPKSAFYTPV